MKALLSALTVVLAFSITAQAQLIDSISQNELMSGGGHTKLGGIKNVRVVIPGVLYRSGNAGGGTIPLTDAGIKALTDHGFSAAVYAYTDGWATKKPAVVSGFEYSTYGGGFKDRAAIKSYLLKVKDVIVNKKGPMLVHCWNGEHASGELSAYALMQFCGLNNQQGQAYWNANVSRGWANKIMRMSRFQVYQDADLRISPEDAARVCPR